MSEMLDTLLFENDVQLVVLGCGEERFEHYFTALSHRFPDKVRAMMKYDRDIAKQVYAAADIFLMPSRTEPCGLSQMIASRYGAIPVVRETGGLYDSIKPYWEEGEKIHGNGFTFAGYSGEELKERTEAAIALWQDTPRRKKLIKKIMTTDFSWNASAQKYKEMYDELG
jgi:starch synthase